MVRSEATSVEQYLAQLPDDRRDAIETVRDVIVENLPDGYVEEMNWGMISYEVPLSIFPDTYNKKPLLYAALANQKRHMSLYLMCLYCEKEFLDWFESEFKKSGKKLNMGKSCVRFKSLEELPLELIAKAVEKISLKKFLSYQKTKH